MKKTVALFLICASVAFAGDLTPAKILNYFGFGSDSNQSSSLEQPSKPMQQPQAADFNTTQTYNNPNGENINSLPTAPNKSLEAMGLLTPNVPEFALPTQQFHEPIYKNLLSISQDGKSAIIDADGLRKGISGLVYQQLDDSHRMLVARSYVSGIKNNKATLRFTVLADTYQPALPTVLNKPKVGDTAVFYLLENRGMVIAPTQADYGMATVTLPQNLRLTHPDIFASFLVPKRAPAPKQKDFRAFCANVQITNLYFVLSDGIYQADCFTFAVLGKTNFTPTNDTPQKPFYNRVGEIPSGYLGMYRQDIENYETYYRNLLGLTK